MENLETLNKMLEIIEDIMVTINLISKGGVK